MATADLGFIHRYEPGSGERTLLLLHGTGGDEDDLLGLGRMIDPQAALLSPRGRVLEGSMPRWFRRLSPGVFDEADLKQRADELADFIDAAVEAYSLRRDGLVAVGYSNGANIAAGLLFRRPDALPAAALLHAMVPYEPDAAPDLDGTRVLVTGGAEDQMAQPQNTRRLAELLEDAGADVTLEMHPGGHELTYDEVEGVKRWLGEDAR